MSYKRADKLKARESRFAEPENIGAIYNEVCPLLRSSKPFLTERSKQARRARDALRERLMREGIIDDPNVPKPLSQALKFTGTCTSMCPEFECIQRQYQNGVDPLEKASACSEITLPGGYNLTVL
jgi:hypothetical protein